MLATAPLACTVSPLLLEGRRCSSTEPCGPGTSCDLVRHVCVRAADANTPAGDRPSADLLLFPDGPRGDSFVAPDGGCPPSYTQCGGICANTLADVAHCGACNSPCPASADRCAGGKCVCGNTAASCVGGLSCVGGSCACVAGPGGPCDGCCENNACVARASQTAARCGKGGATCAPCPAIPCGTAACLPGGDCGSSAPKPDGVVCDDGLFCTVTPKQCKAGACVGVPRNCASAGTGQCVGGACDEPTKACVPRPKANGEACSGQGVCYQGQCCTDCWDGFTCQVGNKAAACGRDGLLCVDCAQCSLIGLGNCGAKHCSNLAKPDGSTCAGGLCWDGGCCKGCWNGTACALGLLDKACGAGGVGCADCTSDCRSGTPTCGSTGVCGATPKVDGSSCASGGGLCYTGSCCLGCWSASQSRCLNGVATSSCGKGGVACKSCPPATQACRTATCTGGVCGIGTSGNGAACTGGTCLGGICCQGCTSGVSCLQGSANAACGTGGAACTDCTLSALVCTNGGCV